MRLIDVDALWERLDYEPWFDNADRDEIALPIVNAAPTVDAVLVTRCENCKYYARWSDGRAMNHCDYHDIVVYDEDFCNRAEPKEDAI